MNGENNDKETDSSQKQENNDDERDVSKKQTYTVR